MKDAIRANVVTGTVAGVVFYLISLIPWSDTFGLEASRRELATLNPITVTKVTEYPLYWTVIGKDRHGRSMQIDVYRGKFFIPAPGEKINLSPVLTGYTFEPETGQ